MRKYFHRFNSIALLAILMLCCYSCPAQSAHTVTVTIPLKGGAVTWPVGLTPTGYKLFRSTTSGGEGGTPLTTITNVNSNTFVDTTVVGGQTYFYTYKLVASCDSTQVDCTAFVSDGPMSDEATTGKIPLPAAGTVPKGTAATVVVN